jgi:hypothetical protein
LFPCSNCDRVFITNRDLGLHKRRAHGIESTNPNSVRLRNKTKELHRVRALRESRSGKLSEIMNGWLDDLECITPGDTDTSIVYIRRFIHGMIADSRQVERNGL